MNDSDFYKGKRIFITGHSGFKGAWLCRILTLMGAEVTGYALEPPTEPSLYLLSGIGKDIHSVTGDIRNFDSLSRAFDEAKPEIVFHLAAQPIVLEGYHNPCYTYETNVMGTVNLLECVRSCASVRSVLNVTTDKVYLNDNRHCGYREEDTLDGYDPYSGSKSCSELVTHSYRRSFFSDGRVSLSTARAGNVIGGGDFARDRIIPDCIRAVTDGHPIIVRNPSSVRPYQYVLGPLSAYLMIAARQYENPLYSGSYNVGPDDEDAVTTEELVGLFCKHWGKGAEWKTAEKITAPHEAEYLKLDSSKIRTVLGWESIWHIEKSVEEVCHFTRIMLDGGDVRAEMDREIGEYTEDLKC